MVMMGWGWCTLYGIRTAQEDGHASFANTCKPVVAGSFLTWTLEQGEILHKDYIEEMARASWKTCGVRCYGGQKHEAKCTCGRRSQYHGTNKLWTTSLLLWLEFTARTRTSSGSLHPFKVSAPTRACQSTFEENWIPRFEERDRHGRRPFLLSWSYFLSFGMRVLMYE